MSSIESSEGTLAWTLSLGAFAPALSPTCGDAHFDCGIHIASCYGLVLSQDDRLPVTGLRSLGCNHGGFRSSDCIGALIGYPTACFMQFGGEQHTALWTWARDDCSLASDVPERGAALLAPPAMVELHAELQ